MYMVRDSSAVIKAGLALVMANAGETPFMSLTVGQLVWGYDEPFFEWITNNVPDFPLPEGFETQFGFLLGVRTQANSYHMTISYTKCLEMLSICSSQ